MSLTQFVGLCTGITLMLAVASIWLRHKSWFRTTFWTWVLFFLALLTVI